MLADADRICSDLTEALRAKVLLAEQIQVLTQQQSDALLLQPATLTAQLTELQRAYASLRLGRRAKPLTNRAASRQRCLAS